MQIDEWFNYLDLMTAHGMHLMKRDAAKIGRRLGIEIFKTVELGEPFKKPNYETMEGRLRIERFGQYATTWFTEAYRGLLERITAFYLNSDKMPYVAYNLTLHFIQGVEVRRADKGGLMIFASKWTSNAEHISGLRRAQAVEGMRALVNLGVIRSLTKTFSVYTFTPWFANGLNDATPNDPTGNVVIGPEGSNLW